MILLMLPILLVSITHMVIHDFRNLFTPFDSFQYSCITIGTIVSIEHISRVSCPSTSKTAGVVVSGLPCQYPTEWRRLVRHTDIHLVPAPPFVASPLGTRSTHDAPQELPRSKARRFQAHTKRCTTRRGSSRFWPSLRRTALAIPCVAAQ